VLERIETGQGRKEDLDLMVNLSNNIGGKTICAFGDAEIAPVLSTLKYFKKEYEDHIREKRCTVMPATEAAVSVS
jgi:NADH-quinone oxidoreductase subunit F